MPYVIVSESTEAPSQRSVLTARASKNGAVRLAAALQASSTQRGRRVYAEERDAYWRRTYGQSFAESAQYDIINAVAPVERI